MNRLFLAGDSTVQSYTEKSFPQTGWGQVLIKCFFKDEEVDIIETHPIAQFSNVSVMCAKDAAGEEIIHIENHAMAGRSSRKFLEEGRYEPMLERMQAGDLLLIQFGHNDANIEKAERYVTPEQFQDKLMAFVEPARKKGVTPILVTPIAMRDFLEDGMCQISFQAYREAMLQLAKRERVSCIDLGLLTAKFCTELGAEECKKLFLWTLPEAYEGFMQGSQDNAHLQYAGAMAFARILYKELRQHLKMDHI